jgi:acyl phosphate:glycerol-3-phosphate acyltransferase
MTADLLLIPAFYLLGCLTSGYYLVRMFKHTDIREHGSGTTGARDVGRVLGPWGLVITSGLDLIKGAIAVRLAMKYGTGIWIAPVGIVMVVIGHIWPVQLGFRGGRGVMPAIGGVMLFDPILMLVYVALLAPVYAVLRRLTLSGMIVVAFAPVIAFVLGRPVPVLLLLCVVSPLILFAHRKSLRAELGWTAGAGSFTSS